MGRGQAKGWIGWFPIQITKISLRGCYLLYINFLGLSHKGGVILSAVTPAHASGKQGDIKAALVLTKLPRSLGP